MKLATVRGVGVGVRTTSMPPSEVLKRTVREGGQVCAFPAAAEAAKTIKNGTKRSFNKSNLTSRSGVATLRRDVRQCALVAAKAAQKPPPSRSPPPLHTVCRFSPDT